MVRRKAEVILEPFQRKDKGRFARVAIVWAVCASAMVFMLMPEVRGGPLVVRSLSQGGPVANVDVMVSRSGEVLVGFTRGDDVELARLSPGEDSFDRIVQPGGGPAASFAADTQGNAYYSALSVGGTALSVGGDLGLFGVFGGLTSSDHPLAANVARFAVPTIALDRAGLPAVAGMDQQGQRFLSRFDVKQNRWLTRTVDAFPADTTLPQSFSNTQSLVFDAAGEPALAYVPSLDAPAAPLLVLRPHRTGWRNVARGDALPRFGTSLAVNPRDEPRPARPINTTTIGWLYVNPGGELRYGSHDGYSTVDELASTTAGPLLPRSLAYDPAGNPAAVYCESDQGGPLHFARRDAGGTWSDEVLGVDCRTASLAFDEEGKPYIAIVTDDGVSLVSQSEVRLLSDLTRNGFVDFDDLSVLLSNWNEDVAAALGNIVSPNDTLINFDDLAVLLSEWTGPDSNPSPQAALGVNSVPEPSALVLATIAALGVCLRRSRRRRVVGYASGTLVLFFTVFYTCS